jgi:hypothetical protein
MSGRQQVYRVEVERTFKGCLQPGGIVWVKTPID